MIYFEIDATLHTIVSQIQGDFQEYNTKETSLLNGKNFLVLVTETVPTFDPAIEYLSAAVDVYVYATNIATRDYTVIAYTQQELDDQDLASDIDQVQSFGKDTILVLIQLVDQLLLDDTIQSTDFDPAVKQAYLDIKVIADRIIANQ